MAGVFGSSKYQKGKNLQGPNPSELINDNDRHQGQTESRPAPVETAKFSLKGILGLGQTIELNHQKDKLAESGKILFSQVNHLEEEERLLFDSRQKELQKSIEELRQEIQQLAKATDNLEEEVEKAAASPIVEVSSYQLNFLDRLRVFIANFRKNISEASAWVETMSHKKNKRNLFWNTVKNKKQGGEQYLFSEEHSVSRSGS